MSVIEAYRQLSTKTKVVVFECDKKVIQPEKNQQDHDFSSKYSLTLIYRIYLFENEFVKHPVVLKINSHYYYKIMVIKINGNNKLLP